MNILSNVYRFIKLDEDESDESSPRTPRKLLKESLNNATVKIRANFSSLNESPRELWIAFVLKFGESYGYFSVSQILVIYLHQEFKISDLEAGAAYGIWGVAITFWGLCMSFINDYLGVRKALLLGFSLSTCSYILLANATSKAAVYSILFIVLPLGNSLGIPMISVGIRRYTTLANRGFAFGIFYATMNLAAFISGPIIDSLTSKIGYDNNRGVALLGMGNFSANRCVILTAALSSFVSFWITLGTLREVRVNAAGALDASADDVQQTSETWTDRQTKLWALLRSPTFWRFSGLTLLLINLNAVFRHLDATFPTYLIRTYGSVGQENRGILYSINPLMIMFLVPLVAAATTSFANFDMIKYGGYVTAIAPFSLAISTSIPAAIIMVVLLSLGEAIWSPRTYDYTYSIAPEGQEASFAALAAAPLFAAKVPVGLLSGYLLSTFCPENGPNHGQTMWLIIGLVTLTSPILITLFEKYIREPMCKVAPADSELDQVRAGIVSVGDVVETPWGDVHSAGSGIHGGIDDDIDDGLELKRGGGSGSRVVPSHSLRESSHNLL